MRNYLRQWKIPFRFGWGTRKLTTEQHNEIIDQYQKGELARDLSIKYNCTRGHIFVILKTKGIQRRKNRESTQRGPKPHIQGDRNHRWKGRKYLNKHGYIIIVNPERFNNGPRTILEHRYIMEDHFG